MSSAKIFNTVPIKKHERNVFDLSHTVKTSGNMGLLIPMLVMECIPGDRHRIGCESMMRLAPMVFPMMHRVRQSMHYYFVPNRLVWEGWEDFITDTRELGGLVPAFPYITMSTDNYSQLADYMGVPNPALIPPGDFVTENINAIPFAAYQMIWYEHFRDQNMIDIEPTYELTDGDNTAQFGALGSIRRRAWAHDYFTSCLPSPQKGPAVHLPIGSFQDVPVFRDAAAIIAAGTLTGSPTVTPTNLANFPADDPAGVINPESLYADTSRLILNAGTLSDVREAWALQAWYEANARGGTRYSEQLKVHFNVFAQDARLQRPEYITGVVNNVMISEVLNTTGTQDAPQGAMAGHGISVMDGYSGSYYCSEHGYIIGVMSVIPDATYQQGLAKHWLKTTDQFDYFFPQFQHLGETPVLNKEIYAFAAQGNGTFGYLPTYSDYRYMSDIVTGDFRTTLDAWHMGRIFTSMPSLNQQFIECDPTHRVFAVTDRNVHKLWIQHRNNILSTRPISKYGVPSTL